MFDKVNTYQYKRVYLIKYILIFFANDLYWESIGTGNLTAGNFIAGDFMVHRVTLRDLMAGNFLAGDFLTWIRSCVNRH